MKEPFLFTTFEREILYHTFCDNELPLKLFDILLTLMRSSNDPTSWKIGSLIHCPFVLRHEQAVSSTSTQRCTLTPVKSR